MLCLPVQSSPIQSDPIQSIPIHAPRTGFSSMPYSRVAPKDKILRGGKANEITTAVELVVFTLQTEFQSQSLFSTFCCCNLRTAGSHPIGVDSARGHKPRSTARTISMHTPAVLCTNAGTILLRILLLYRIISYQHTCTYIRSMIRQVHYRRSRFR